MKKIITILYLFATAMFAADLTGRDIINNMEAGAKPINTIMNIKLTQVDIRRGEEKQRVREMVRYLKSYPSGKYVSKTLMRFIKPDIAKGTGFLVWSNRSGGAEQWLFLPKIKAAKKIESKAKSKRFMNTEFSYEDLESLNQPGEQYFLKCEENVNDLSCYKIEVVSHTQTSYKRRLIWIDKTNWLMQKVEFYDKKNKLLKTLNINIYQKLENFWFATNMVMKNHQTGSSTVMEISDIKYNQNLEDSYFSTENLTKVE